MRTKERQIEPNETCINPWTGAVLKLGRMEDEEEEDENQEEEEELEEESSGVD